MESGRYEIETLVYDSSNEVIISNSINVHIYPATISDNSIENIVVRNLGNHKIELQLSANYNYNIGLIDINGRVVDQAETNTNTVTLNALQSGIYIIHLNSGNKNYTQKIWID